MSQKLTRIIQASVSGEAFTASAVFPMKSKKDVWSKASKKAWKVRKRQARARAAAKEAVRDQEQERAA